MNRVSTTPVEIVVTGGESSKRIDVFLANRDPTFSRLALQRLIGEGRILINGQTIRPSQKIKPGDRIRLEVPRPEPLDLKPEAIPFEILHEDADLL
ncbi:MAG: RluA family pseudouridine synthase, partial [Nitrospira sp.]|nr:RluA family pseudouridine synthase [Nitrospira sp.]